MTVDSSLSSAANIRDVTREIFSASLGSICCCYTGQPLDTIKVRMQTNPAIYNGMVQTFHLTVKMEGSSALWKGAVPAAFGMITENAVAFSVNEFLKRAFPDPNLHTHNSINASNPDLLRPFAIGGFTGLCSGLVLNPSEVIKAKTQVSLGTDQNPTTILRQLIKRQGFKSLYVGLDAQLMLDLPFYAAFFGGYELNCYLIRTHLPSIPEELNYLISGGFAGIYAWTIALPLDVPKTNVQSRWDTKVVGSYFPEMVSIVKRHGFLGLYNGLRPTLLRAFPANAALFWGVENGKKIFDDIVWKI